MQPNFYWETQRGGLCRLHSLNAFMNSVNGSKGYFSEQKFRELCNEFDKEHNLENTSKNVDLALAVSNTGASVDMYLLNIPIIIFRDVNSINFSPFVKYSDEIKYVTNTKELENALDSMGDYNLNNDEFLWVDKNLNKWTKLLNKLI